MNKTLWMVCLAWCACGPIVEEVPVDEPTPHARVEAPLTSCTVALPGTPTRVATYAFGVLVGLEDGTVLRGEGVGCELHFSRTGVVGALLDVDAFGNAYVMADEAFQRERFADVFGDLVVRLEPSGTATAVVSAGRGIWGFGISPTGRTMWVSACGPTGVLSTEDASQVLPADPPWEVGTALLTDDETYWSSRAEQCTQRGSVCTQVLVRTTKAGDSAVWSQAGETIGAIPLLARCGSGVCVAFGGGLQELDAAGNVVRAWSRGELSLGEAEVVRSFGVTSGGIYSLREGGSGARVAFTPR